MHEPVMRQEVIEHLLHTSGGCYIDATFGRGGHTAAILEKLGDNAQVIAIDQDPEAIQFAQAHFSHDKRLQLVQSSFTRLKAICDEFGVTGQVQGILLDLGVSSPQLDEASRGFSFMRDGPLDMRMDPSSGVSAQDWLNSAEEADIAFVLKEYGEERQARKIAKAIVAARAVQPIVTTHQLAELVAKTIGRQVVKKHPATRTFQAIRIFINGELDALKTVLTQVIECLALKGRLAVISFHSLEDRIVKQFIREYSQAKPLPRRLPVMPSETPMPLRSVVRKMKASEYELQSNVRARSAVLRIAERML